MNKAEIDAKGAVKYVDGKSLAECLVWAANKDLRADEVIVKGALLVPPADKRPEAS